MGEIVERNTQRNKSLESENVLTISSEYGLINQEEYFNKLVASKNLTNYYLLKKDDFAYNKSYSNGYPYGAIKKLNNYPDGIVSSLYIVFRSISTDVLFLEAYFDGHYWHKEIRKISAEGARNHGLLNTPVNDFFTINITIPGNEEEQKNIGKLLSTISKLEALYERKHQQLQQLKEALLQQMFPQKGEKVPRLRFANFEGDWEQHKFSEIASRSSKTTDRTDLPKIEYDDVIGAGAGRLNKEYNYELNSKKGILFEKDDVLFGKLRPYLSKWFLSSFMGVAVGDWWVFRGTLSDPIFLYAIIQTNTFKNHSNISTGTRMPRSDWSIVSNIMLYIPCLSEQKRIGKLIEEIDKLTALYERKYQQLQRLKDASLQKMFI